jgi:hypothetical protein
MPAAASVGVRTLVLLLCDTLAFFSIPSQERVHAVLSLPTWLEVGSALLLMAPGTALLHGKCMLTSDYLSGGARTPKT